ncbi:Nn.00g085680.m01.CDS01 [Neocucurbitaria sp. VM-36]
MSIIRSLQASAFILSFSTLTDALALNRRSAGNVQNGLVYNAPHIAHGGSVEDIVEKRQDAQELDCPDDRWQQMLDNNPPDRVATFCNEWLGIGPATTVVEWTPTITITTSAASTTITTSTTRLITTQTVMQTTTTTTPALAVRAANIAAVAEDIIESVIASGTTEAATASKNWQRVQAESGLANACSCKMVDPTATVTSSFALPPVFTTVGFRKIILVSTTDTRVFTALTTVTVASDENGATSTAVSDTAASSTALSWSMSVSNATSSASTEAAVVTAIPFSCPDAADSSVDQVVGDFKLDYLVLCNTELITQDRVGKPISVDDETSCAAQCSLVNAQGGQDTCQGASFEPYTDGRLGGACTLTASEPTYVDKPGSVAVVHTGTLSNGDECNNLNSAANSSSSVDTSALVASITSAGVSISTPGLITQSVDGGVFETYVSANSTDASGYVHWSWYAVSASSSFWWAVYSTSWECTATISRTIVQQPAEPTTITSVLITTIINGATTTIISGTSTRVFTNGGGLIPPTFVPASTTEGNGEVTTYFSLATETSTGASGLVPPTAFPSPSGNSSLIIEGAGNATVSGGTLTIYSTGDEGVIPPSTISPAGPNSTAGVSGDVLTVVSTGGTQFSTSGSTFTRNATGGEGVIPPASTGVSAGFTTSDGTSTSQGSGSTGGFGPSSNLTVATATFGSGNSTTAGSTFTSVSTGDNGIITPIIGTGASTLASLSIQAVSNSSVPPNTLPTITVTLGGSLALSTSGSTATTNSTGASGVIPPLPSANVTVILSVSVASGGTTFATSSSTFTSGSTGDFGVIPPANTGSVIPSANETIPLPSSTGGTGNLTISGGTAVTSATSNSGVIPPSPSAEVTVSSGGGNFTTSGGTAVTSSTATGGVIPPSSEGLAPTPNVNFTSASGTGGLSIQGSTAVTLASSGSGVILPSLSSNASSTSTGPPFANSDAPRTPFFNETASIPGTGLSVASVTPSPSLNVSSTSTGNSFGNTDANRTPFPLSSTALNSTLPSTASSQPAVSTLLVVETVSVVIPPASTNATAASPSFSSLAVPPVSANSTAPIGTASSSGIFTEVTPSANTAIPPSNSSSTVPPSLTPSLSLNISSSSTGPPFTNSDAPRTPFFNETTPLPGTGFSVASVTPSPSSNSSVPAPSAIPSVSVNITFIPPSVTPSISANASSTGPQFTNSGADRTGGFNGASTSRASTGVIAPSSNATTSLPPTITTVLPPPFGNSTVPSGTGFTAESVGIPTPSANSTITSSQTTGNASSIPSATPTISLNSTTPDVCPTAAVVVTVTSVEVATSVQVLTTTLVQTVTVGPASALSDASATPTPSILALADRFRRSGSPATQEQIDAACADPQNIVLNPNFAVTDSGEVPGWSVDASDPVISVESEQNPGGNGTIAQFRSAVVGRTLSITQPITLCPGQQYSLSALNRQANVLAKCVAKYSVGDDTVFNVTPQQSWLPTDGFFTAGAGVTGASVNLSITASCAGYGGLPVSDQEGWMRVEVSGVSIVKDEDSQRKKRGDNLVIAAPRKGFFAFAWGHS